MTTATIVIPCFNEAERFDAEAFGAFNAMPVRFLLVDDGSTDATGEVLARLAATDPDRFDVITLEQNQGKAEAVRRGMLAALADGSDYVGFFDADLSTGLDEIPRLVEVLERRPGLSAVFGARVRMLGRSIERSLIRHWSGRVFATFAALMLRLPAYDTQCGAKVFRATPEVTEAFTEPFLSRWVFDVELLARLIGSTPGRNPEDVVVEQPLVAWRDVRGSKVKFRHGVRSLFELVRIRRRYRHMLRR